jgi:tetratricopeptide (TPR) repeat protein
LDRPVETSWFDNIIDKISYGPVRPTHIDSLSELMSCIGNGCEIPLETMEHIFRVALNNDNLARQPVIHAELLNIYSYFTINKTGNFEKGLELFTRALELDPAEPVRWLNLVNLQIAMARYDEAEQTLERFRNAGTHGSVVNEIHELQSSIDTLRANRHADTGPDTTNQLP